MFTAPVAGTYAFAYRFSYLGEQNLDWLYCATSWTTPGDAFADQGTLTVP